MAVQFLSMKHNVWQYETVGFSGCVPVHQYERWRENRTLANHYAPPVSYYVLTGVCAKTPFSKVTLLKIGISDSPGGL